MTSTVRIKANGGGEKIAFLCFRRLRTTRGRAITNMYLNVLKRVFWNMQRGVESNNNRSGAVLVQPCEITRVLRYRESLEHLLCCGKIVYLNGGEPSLAQNIVFFLFCNRGR